MRRALAVLAVSAAIIGGLAACSSDADTVSNNLSQEAEQFKVQRRIIVINSITDKYLMTVEGLCSIERTGGQLEITCKIGPGAYTKDFIGLADNVTYLVQQSEDDATGVSKYHHKVVLKPESIVPDFDVELGEQ